MKSIEAHTKVLELDDHGARKIDRIVRKLYIHYIHSFHTEQAPTSLLPSHDPTTTQPRRAPCHHRLSRQRRRRPGHIVPPQLMDTVLVLAQLRHRPLPRQLLRAPRLRLPPLVAPALALRTPHRRRHRPLRFQPPLLSDQQRDARRQERPERYPDAEAHGQGVGARRRGRRRRRRRGGGRGRGPDGHGHGRRSGGGVGGGGGVGVGEPDAVRLGARELGVAQEEAEGGEGEVGGAGAAAFAFPDAGGGAGEDVHGCVALSWGGEGGCQLLLLLLLLKEEGGRGEDVEPSVHCWGQFGLFHVLSVHAPRYMAPFQVQRLLSWQ